MSIDEAIKAARETSAERAKHRQEYDDAYEYLLGYIALILIDMPATKDGIEKTIEVLANERVIAALEAIERGRPQ